MAGRVRAFVGVGANLGDAVATVRAALHMLGRLPDPLPPATAGSPQPSPTPDPALH
jgi:7,8-dihydro-6-hydroxymethylpterin-pyrophosphokinase